MRAGLRWLVRRADFQAAAKGRRAAASAFTLQARRRAEDEGPREAPRFGLTATRKIGGAVERNRMKRRLRAALAALAGEGAVFGREGHDYVVVLRRDALSIPFEALVASLTEAMGRVHAAKRPASAAERARTDRAGMRPDQR